MPDPQSPPPNTHTLVFPTSLLRVDMALQVGQLVRFKDNGDCWGTVFGARRAMPRRDAAVLLLLLLLLGIHDALR